MKFNVYPGFGAFPGFGAVHPGSEAVYPRVGAMAKCSLEQWGYTIFSRRKSEKRAFEAIFNPLFFQF